MRESKASRWNRRTQVAAVGFATAAVTVRTIVALMTDDSSAGASSPNQNGGVTAGTAYMSPPAPTARHLSDADRAELRKIPLSARVVVATAGDTRETATYADEIAEWLRSSGHTSVTAVRRQNFPKTFGLQITQDDIRYDVIVSDQRP